MKRILIVDDEPMMLKIAERALKDNYETVTALSGEEALDYFDSSSFDLVLSDVKMPSMSGLDLMLKMRVKDPDILVVFMSADDGEVSSEEMIKQGASGYISKPIKAQVLSELVTSLLSGEALIAGDGEESKVDEGAGGKNALDDSLNFKKEEEKLPEWLVLEPLIDTTEGLKNSEDAESYISAIKIFLEHVDDNVEVLKRCLEDGDIENYTIKAHALKSTSRIIGAMVLSTMAAAMERAGKVRNFKFISKEHEEFISLYRKYEQVFLSHMETSDKEPIPQAVLQDIMVALKEYVQAEDFTLTKMAMDSLNEYKLPDDIEKTVLNIKHHLLKLDWDQIRVIMDIE
ncbi:response regulator [Butyrivibrio sp. VCB2006]|uniref:response regulator n=1 Tax=Butyrivibrio sp. VCB2006 TaxID=1280679 RepID=UPI0004291EA7|nr:response regulator [Butyrivibrio sp. VCB2006]